MSVPKAIAELGQGLAADDGKRRAEAIGAFCRCLMIEGEVDVPREALDEITTALCEDDDDVVQQTAADFIAWTTEWTDTDVSPALLGKLGSVLEDDGRDAAHALVARALGFVAPEKVNDSQLAAIEGRAIAPAPIATRIEALEALGRLEAQSSSAMLLQCLDDPIAEIRRTAVIAIGLLGDGEAHEDALLKRFASEETTEVRAAIMRALTMIGSEAIGEKVTTIAMDQAEDEAVRVEALKAVPIVNHPAFEQTVLAALIDDSELLREAACLLMTEQRADLQEEGFEEALKKQATALEGKPEQALMLWALHRWRCACAGRGAMPEFSRRLDDFLVEYAEQSLLADPTALTRRIGNAGGKKKGPE